MAGLEDLTPEQLRAFNVGKLLLESDPEIKRSTLRLAKKANPKLNIPEVDLEDRLDAQDADARKREQKLSDELMAERVARRQSERNRQIEAAGFVVADIEKIIVDEKCGYETALKIAELQARTADPGPADIHHSNPIGMPVEMRPDKDWRKLDGAGLRKRSAQVASEMITGFRNARRPAAR
jgi:hypothetical protein